MDIIEHVKGNWKNYLIGIMGVFVLFMFLGSVNNMGSNFSKSKIGSNGMYESMDVSYSQKNSYDRDISSSNSGFAPDEVERKQIKNANINIESNEYWNDKSVIGSAVSASSGIVINEQESFSQYSKTRSYYLNVKIRAESLDLFVSQVKELGQVTSLNVYTNDVTGTYGDYTQRVVRYNEQIERYKNILVKSNITIQEEIQLQSRIDSLEDSIFRYTKSISDIDEDVVYSNIVLRLNEKPSVWVEFDFLGLKEGFNLFMGSVQAAVQLILLLFGFVIPFGIVYLIYRVVKIPFKK